MTYRQLTWMRRRRAEGTLNAVTGAAADLDGRTIEAVLVDAGGVLVNPNWETVATILGRHGIEADAARLEAADPFLKRELDQPDLVRSTTDVARRERWLARLLRHAHRTHDAPAIDGSAVDAATDEIDALHRERGIWEVIPPGTTEALDALRAAGLRLSLASNAEPLLRSKLELLGLADRFDHLAISAEVGLEKPDPRFFQSALDALGVGADRAVHVGDFYEIDVAGARAAGLAAVLVDVADLSGDRDVPRIHSLAELPALLGLGAAGSHGTGPAGFSRR